VPIGSSQKIDAEKATLKYDMERHPASSAGEQRCRQDQAPEKQKRAAGTRHSDALLIS